MHGFFKPVIAAGIAFLVASSLSGCSTNPATGDRQFTALMSPDSEASIGAEEHQNILQQFGGTIRDTRLSDYVSSVGQRVAANTERPDVHYQFFVLDTPVVNAFALPGGYIYVTRGLLALANSEAQLAGVLAHEIGHVTARHAAERYSHGMLTSLGAAAIGAAVGSSAATQVANLGSDLYLTSYSRAQESQADELGVRYLYKAGYDPLAMAQFLTSLARYSAFEGQENGNGNPGFSYFSTHPETASRAVEAQKLAATYPANAKEEGQDKYLHTIDGMMFGDSSDQGLVRGTTFWHPQMGFTFTAPNGFLIVNNPDQVVIRNEAGSIVGIFDSAPNPKGEDAMTYLTHLWMKGDSKLTNTDNITIHGKPAASAEFDGVISKTPVMVRLVAVEWSPTQVFRFQVAMPQDANPAIKAALKQMTNSLRNITAQEQQTLRPYRLKLVTAVQGDTVATLSQTSPLQSLQEQRFRALNGLSSGEAIIPGHVYKTVAE